MIQLSFLNAFILYLFITLFTLLGLWLSHHYREQKKKWVPYEHSLFTCEYCQFTYLALSNKKINQCPHCELFNESASSCQSKKKTHK